MDRRRYDDKDPLRTFYITPKSLGIMWDIQAMEALSERMYLRGSLFERAELIRDFLEENTNYSREALDDQLGDNVQPIAIDNPNLLAFRILDELLSNAGGLPGQINQNQQLALLQEILSQA